MTVPVLNFDAPAVIDGEYRYSLTRQWAPHLPPMVFIMLNPSTADGKNDDPTILRCKKRALRDNRCGGLVVVNLFALRSTDPGALKRRADPVGPDNDAWVLGAATIPGAIVVAAWGANEYARWRALDVTAMLAGAGVRLRCLGVNKDGSPKHPLFVSALAPLIPYEVTS